MKSGRGPSQALMTTPLNAAQIVFGKLTSRLVMLAILALLVAPLLLAIRVFGGLDGRVVIATTAISLSTAFLGAALGLMYSTWHKRASNAAVFGLLTLVLLQAAPSAIEGVIYYVVNSRDVVTAGRRPEYKYHQDVLATCAPATMAMISERAVMGGDLPEMELTWLPHRQEQIGATSRPVPFVAPTWALNTGYNILVGLLVTLYSTVVLRRSCWWMPRPRAAPARS
jgi:ABC-type transport system involved in multi-copper enzyme maturation permease subunit